MQNQTIDNGKAFDWGKTSENYAKYRDIYPPVFYEKIIRRNLAQKGQTMLDVGTGTGVLPRNLCKYGAKWVGVDSSEQQIEQAKLLSRDLNIIYRSTPVEQIDFSENTFDGITACQCFWYFDHEIVMPKFHQILKPNGRLLILYLAWLPFEDPIAGASEDLVLRYNPDWSGRGETTHPIAIPDCYFDRFTLVSHEEFPVKVHFTRESWNGRMKTCRGIGAALSPEQIEAWEKEHLQLLAKIAPEEFDILHYGAVAELQAKK